jgi:hypothetical protein
LSCDVYGSAEKMKRIIREHFILPAGQFEIVGNYCDWLGA